VLTAADISQAGRIIAQMIMMGSGVFLKAAGAAYRKAIISAPLAQEERLGFVHRCTPPPSLCSACLTGEYVRRDADGTKAGVTADAVGKAAGSKATMTVEEARQILGIDPATPAEEVMKVRARLSLARLCAGRCASPARLPSCRRTQPASVEVEVVVHEAALDRAGAT
jgi:hypothetical protein